MGAGAVLQRLCRKNVMAMLQDLIEMLVGALRRPHQREELVRAFQEAVSNEPESPSHGAGWDVLTTLATDLECYVPDPEARVEHRNYYGDERLRQEILSALRELVEAGVISSDSLTRAAGPA